MNSRAIMTQRFPFIASVGCVMTTFSGVIPAIVQDKNRRDIFLCKVIHQQREIEIIAMDDLKVHKIRSHRVDIRQQIARGDMRETGLFAGQAGEQRVKFMIQRDPRFPSTAFLYPRWIARCCVHRKFR